MRCFYFTILTNINYIAIGLIIALFASWIAQYLIGEFITDKTRLTRINPFVSAVVLICFIAWLFLRESAWNCFRSDGLGLEHLILQLSLICLISFLIMLWSHRLIENEIPFVNDFLGYCVSVVLISFVLALLS